MQSSKPNIFFDTNTLAPLVDNKGWRTAAKLLKRLNRAGVIASKGPNKDFEAGECAFLLALPGTAKKAILAGIKRKDVNGTTVWHAGVDAAERVLTPGSNTVLQPDGSLRACDGTGSICPHEQKTSSGVYVNRAPFFVTGGWGASIRKSASETNKQIAWMYVFLSRLQWT